MPNFTVSGITKYFVMIIVVMIGIFAVKWAAKKWNVPVVSDLAAAV